MTANQQYGNVPITIPIDHDIKLKDTKVAKSITSDTFNLIYDIVAAIISLADIITDVIIMIEFYIKGRMIFFYISLSIILLANLSYVLIFMKRYNSGPYFGELVCVCCMLLPLAPCLSFLMYFMDDSDSLISNCMFCCLDRFSFAHYSFNTDDENSDLQKWFETKISKHIGFIVESLMESIPQTLLQMVAIVYFDEVNIVFFISVILSMLSISIKSLVFSASISVTNTTMFYTWISSITDFFSIFMAISLIFYSNQALQDALDLIQVLWIYKVLIFVLPLCLYISFGLWITGMTVIIENYCYGSCLGDICVIIVGFIGVTLTWSFGVFLGTIGLEVCCFMYLACLIFSIGHGRIPHTSSNRIWLNILHFIKNQSYSYDTDSASQERNVHVSRQQDKIVRICSVNRQLLLMKDTNPKLHEFLTVKEHETQFRDVSYSDIRRYTKNGENGRLLWWRIKNWYNTFYDKYSPEYGQTQEYAGIIRKFIYGVLYICFPWYSTSRLINILFPYIAILILYIHSANFYYEIGTFQIIMLLIYCFLQLLIIILLIINYQDEHIIFHLAPDLNGSNSLYRYLDDTFYVMVKSYYDRLILKPIILSVLCDIFQNDIGRLIFQYMPFYLDEEQHSELLKKKAAQYTKGKRHYYTSPLIVAAFRK